MKFSRSIILTVTYFFASIPVFAVSEQYYGEKIGSAFHKDSILAVKDDKFNTGAWTTIDTNLSTHDLIIFELNDDTTYFKSVSFTCDVTLKIEYWDSTNTHFTIYKTLDIAYDPGDVKQYNARAIFAMEDAFKLKITIDNINFVPASGSTAVPPVFRLRAEIHIERKYIFDCTANLDAASTVNSTTGTINVTWDEVDGAEEYDLEWTFYHDSSDVIKIYHIDSTATYSDYNTLFRHNATRVTITGNIYRIQNIYEKGYVFYRIRAIQYSPDSIRKQTPWITEGYSHVFYTNPYMERVAGHENGINWQYSIQFAEEGKNIPSVNYFDGSMRSRQTVVRSEAAGKVIVSETLYDHQGRAAVQTIPAPIDDNNAKIKFYTEFSMVTSTKEYTRDTFDIGTCDFIVPPMDSAYGASKWFSKNNSDWNNAITTWTAAAERYPFSVTEYTPDLTGRIKRQTNVGSVFKLGCGKETKYFYGPADQAELDRVFGNEIGMNEHYWKTMVVDPNGSISVSYSDGSGHVIATALAGETPDNLQELASNIGSETITTNLLDIAPIVGTDFLEYNYTLLVSTAGTHSFDYLMGSSEYSIDCIPEELGICFDCLYDISLEVTDLCNNTTLPGDTSYHVELKNYDLGAVYDTLCGGATVLDPVTDNFSIYLAIGEYHVKNKITVSAVGKEQYFETYLRQDTCILTLDDFIDSAMAEIDFSGCNLTCEECTSDLGTQEEFVDNYLDELVLAGITLTESDTIDADSIYFELLGQCDLLCDTVVTECEALYAIMVADVSPGGQYAHYTVDGSGNWIAGDTSVLNSEADMFAGGKSYADLEYTDEYGNPDFVTIDGFEWAPNELTLEQFIELFPLHPSWADTLVTLHPEYCAHEWCSNHEDVYEYAADMLNTDLFDDADENGYLDPLNQDVDPYSFVDYDPFFDEGGPGATYLSDMKDDLTKWEGSDYSAWELASFGANCPDEPCFPIPNINDYCPGNAKIGWIAFRAMYLSRRGYYIYQVMNDSCDLSLLNIGVSGDFENMQRRVLYYNDAIDMTAGMDTADMADYADSVLTESCTTNCEAMADSWIALLEPCYAGMSAEEEDSLRAGLIEVCIAGCDFGHPFGASDLTGSPILGDTTASGYSSFQDVIEKVLDVLPGDTLCNALLIDFPDPYSNPSAFGPEVYMGDYQDSCVCLVWEDKYKYEYLPDSSEYDSFADFLSQKYGSTLSENIVDEIMDVCTDTNCIYTTELITLPSALSCKPCVFCDQLARENFNDFFTDYPDSGFVGYETTIASYFNSIYGFNLTFSDWKQFYDDCLNGETSYISDGEPCEACGYNQSISICDEPIITSTEFDTATCREYLMNIAVANATLNYEHYLDSLKNSFWAGYVEHCLESAYFQEFTVERPMNEYHYTLYYYDQAGNLIQTVPPEGVDMLDATEQSNQATYRTEGTGGPEYPEHTLATRYYYNTLNQLIKQYTPDGDTTRFWYDRLGRIVVSQNARQRSYDQYSYTHYDALGRIVETGQLEQSTDMTFSIALDNEDLADWIDNGTPKTEVSSTYYDNEALDVGLHFRNNEQTNLRNRIVSVTWEQEDDGDSLTYDYATHYSYDIAGNVFTLVQELGGLRATENDFKRIDYEYDLISGKVNKVSYQPDSADEFYHEYLYDEDNRLTSTLTSRDGYRWDYDANYIYYKHGPLRRTEIGERQVQGIDYAYTLQGWLKGLNSEGRDKDKDMGLDGKASGPHKLFGRDVATFVLSYFEGDYKPIGTGRFTATYSTGAGFGASSPSLYNGNIRKATYSISKLSDAVLGYAYQYDQLNRLVGMDAWFNFNTGSYSWPGSGSASAKLKERVSYDGNGNILTYIRHGYSPTRMDSLRYAYYGNSNKLLRVDDTTSTYTIDIDDQGGVTDTNYVYDATGNLIADTSEEIGLITWTLMGKIDSIGRISGSSKPELKFFYDAMGNRVGKVVYDGSDVIKTWYIRDAQGNIMATYEENNDTLRWTEQHIYGSSRLGYWQPDSVMYPKPVLVTTDTFRYHLKFGDKRYELTNHLGNVLAVFTDRKIPQETGTPNNVADFYIADIASTQDYYPFGMGMPNRSWSVTIDEEYRFGFNAKENDDAIKGDDNSLDFGARIYDPRIGKWTSSDPKSGKYPALSPYHFGYNNPIITIDPNGEENIIVVGADKNSEQGNKMTNKFRNASIKFYKQFEKNNPNEKSTILVYVDPNSTTAELDKIKEGFTKKGVNEADIKFVTSSKDVITYMNTRPTNITMKDGPIGIPILVSEDPDLITDFVYVGHGYKNALLIDRPNGGKSQVQSDGNNIYSVDIVDGKAQVTNIVEDGVFSENACTTLATCRWESTDTKTEVMNNYNLVIAFSKVGSGSMATGASSTIRFDDDKAEYQGKGSVVFQAGQKVESLSGQKDAFESGISGDQLKF